MRSFDTRDAVERLRTAGGGYEIVHESPGLDLGVYVLVAPEADRQQPHEDDEVYVVLEGSGVFLLEGRELAMRQGDLLVAPEGVPHGVTNTGATRLLVLAVLAPAPR